MNKYLFAQIVILLFTINYISCEVTIQKLIQKNLSHKYSYIEYKISDKNNYLKVSQFISRTPGNSWIVFYQEEINGLKLSYDDALKTYIIVDTLFNKNRSIKVDESKHFTRDSMTLNNDFNEFITDQRKHE